MATLAFTALGTMLGGPLGGALGSLIGNQIDRAIIGGSKREGPRLRELAVTASSYGTPLAWHYGTMRAPGTIIWSTDLIESSEKSGGGKGQPSTTSYSYSISFAVALAGRPIERLGRVWADGNLLRGAAGDLKVGGELRVYQGYGDQQPDPLIASALGGTAPAFRGRAYCVFETLQLGEFGNRIPALNFEIIADDGEVTLAQLVEPVAGSVAAGRPLSALRGFSNEGGPLAATLETVDQVYPLACTAGADKLVLGAADELVSAPPFLPEPAAAGDEDSFGASSGQTSRRQADQRQVPDGLRYYDTSRDYQAGLQRADGRARPGRSRLIEFPGALDAGDARSLANAAAERAGWSREVLAWRLAELDPALQPGSVVRAPGHAGHWRIESWEWRAGGVELELRRLPRGPARRSAADAGVSLPAPDYLATPTELITFELPWDGHGSLDARKVYAAVSSSSRGWTGAALYSEQAGDLAPLGASGSRRSIMGRIAAPLGSSTGVLLERGKDCVVDLISPDFLLSGTSANGLAAGHNRALIGDEVVQFTTASPVGAGRWCLDGLLRGRGGTEAAALRGHLSGAPFVLLDDRPVLLNSADLPQSEPMTIAALGLADAGPILAPVVNPGATLRPLPPVHPRSTRSASGALVLSWTRRARGAWGWPDLLETPLNEQQEAYLVGLGPAADPLLRWEVREPTVELDPAVVSAHAGAPLWVRQAGSFAMSDPLLLTILS